jgi:hypothetical protein
MSSNKELSLCYEAGGTLYDPEDLREEWLTGCPLCGGVCWNISSEERYSIEEFLKDG